MKRIMGVAMLVAVVAAVPAFAAGGARSSSAPNTGEIGFGIGQSDVSSDTTGIDSAQSIGVRGGYNFNKQWQLEGQIWRSSENGDIAGTDVDTTMKLVMVNGVMNFHPRKKEIVPYVMAGFGRADVEVKSSGTSVSDDSVAIQVGGGTRIYFGKTQRMAFRTDLSFLREGTFDDTTTTTTVTAGLTFKLGGR